jgi:HSP20 family protein
MISLDNVSKTFSRTWDSVSQGWNHLVHRASNALTPFHGDENKEDNSTAGTTRWGLVSADIYDDNESVIVTLEAPGMEEGNFDISIVENLLYVKGEKHFFKEQTEGDFTIRERAYGNFERVLPLGYEVDADSAEATYKQGVLRIKVNKSAEHKRRQIPVH